MLSLSVEYLIMVKFPGDDSKYVMMTEKTGLIIKPKKNGKPPKPTASCDKVIAVARCLWCALAVRPAAMIATLLQPLKHTFHYGGSPLVNKIIWC